MKSKLRAAFEAACSGYAPDRVVADPRLNEIFLAECRREGLVGSDATLNHALLNLRKRGELRGIASKKTLLLNQDEYRFAAEIAARVIERRDGLSLDDIICDPALAQEFDSLAARIAPGFGSLEYRWAALSLRKTTKLKPEILARVARVESVQVLPVTGLDLKNVPRQQGLYVLLEAKGALYVGEAENLNTRIRKHLDHSDNKGLARWLWEEGTDSLHLELHTLPADTTTRIRRALEAELILSRDPLFNVKRIRG